MIFLLEYDRPTGKLVMIQNYAERHRSVAQERKLQLELDLRQRHVQHEVVLLEAESEEVLRQSYRRYFQDLATLARTTADSLRVPVREL